LADFILDKKITTLYEPTIQIEDVSINASAWEWSFGDGKTSGLNNPTEHTYSTKGTFNLKLLVSNPSGCKDSLTQVLTIELPTSIYMPTSFSPNGDGINDIFLPKGDGIIEYTLSIYNRWGALVFYSNDINVGWDGMVDGTIADPMGTYVYVVTVKDAKKHDYIYRGTVNLLW
jgi:gliding motility-associated-like protein